MNTMYTVGYSRFRADEMIALLTEHAITCVVDVRSRPYSQYHLDFDKERFEKLLRQASIRYRHYAAEFGARQTDPRYHAPGGYLDFELFAASDAFRRGVDKLRQGMALGFRFALMCAEKDPIDCHRAILVARAFDSVVHLLPDGQTQSQHELEARLLDRYFPERAQISLFGEGLQPDDELIPLAYRKRNGEIGYSMEGDSP